jgi:hypothetical protein
MWEWMAKLKTTPGFSRKLFYFDAKIFLDKGKGEYILSCQNLAGSFWKSRLRQGWFYGEVREDILFFLINKFS